ncbi:MAG TPA: hypothetical protein VEC11_07540 [Allosphingosinicella sp.]|nr:hypothetical protein [Allosphingosinicella sp.]
MSDSPKSYFALLGEMRKDAHAASALKSLDVIDTKAGGLAGLIGGFAAASTIVLQSLWAKADFPVATIIVGGSLGLFAFAGLMCATCLTIISHFDKKLFEGSEALEDQERIDAAASKALIIYNGRVFRYRLAVFALLGGIAILVLGVIVAGGIALLP